MRFVLGKLRSFVEKKSVRGGRKMSVLLGCEGGEGRWEGNEAAGAEGAFADAGGVRCGKDVVRVGGYGCWRFLVDGWWKSGREERLR